ncbi:MAG TPA: thioesterase family protein [Burkholderiaceae bacterium]|nr:thioesterase family protein [Burkholderiaceae bacterium]
MAFEDFGFRHRLRVRWAEADMQGVVFNGHYLTYFDVAVTEYWRGVAGGDPQALREIFDRLYVVKTTIEFRSPARFDDELDVAVRCAKLGNSSMRVLFEIHRGADHLISGDSVYVYAEDGRSTAIPPRLREAIQSFEKVTPE